MLKGFRVHINWRKCWDDIVMMATIVALGLVPIAVVAGLASGLPWPPRWDDFTFGIAMLAGTMIVFMVCRQVGSDFMEALRKLREIQPAQPEISSTGQLQGDVAPCRSLRSPASGNSRRLGRKA